MLDRSTKNIVQIGDYKGEIHQTFDTPLVHAQLASLPKQLQHDQATRISNGPDYVVKLPLNTLDGELLITVKVFKRQGFLKDWHDRRHKSKAERSFNAAVYLQENGISTPMPIAWLDKWEGNRLIESYYLCVFQPAICFRDALVHIYRSERDNETLIALLHHVALALKAMHDAGFIHGDLGNQNILLPKDDAGHWQSPSIIDLNRYKISSQPLTNKERALDLSRIMLPGDYLRIFKWVYFNHQQIPKEFEEYDLKFRAQFERHRKSRKYRHPLRHLKNRHKKPSHPTYPPAQDIWLWDEKSAQPMISLGKQEKNKQRNIKHSLLQAMRTLRLAPRIYREYRQLMQQSFSEQRNMHHRIGVALHPKSDYIEQELQLLAQLGNPPVLLRFCHHETLDDWHLGLDLAQRLYAQNIPFTVALLHDRQAILNPQRWKDFLATVISTLADKAQQFEITHALNRVKWGIWNSEEFAELMRPAFALQQQYPAIKFIGPAAIDFEYHAVINALSALDGQPPFAGLSHLLYVDRRGAPENKQGGFSTVEKSALLKAVARAHPQCDDKVIISEVNWPLKGGDIWSPVMCPYLRPQWRQNPIGETESDYANYMLRYLVLTICSGHVEQVYWWRLSAHGYGLVDDKDNFRKRPAFTALAFFLQMLGDALFVQKCRSTEHTYLLEFQKNDQKIIMAWSTGTPCSLPNKLDYDVIYDREGNVTTQTELTGAPIYLLKHNPAS